ncbi:Zn-ribbon domain-containing OB-fold protein [Nocardioides sp.]|uniref:Zn-ribbon domain-containing OB-fold protein n=1 Tax=Nocardioides sp. TaxID=35761 RepID=UPI0026309C5B|nr:OB-fold nucleic acid binding domain-containing protein [Nocardioides sp.]
MTPTLTAPFGIEFGFSRTVGPQLAVFFGQLRAGRLVGALTADGAVLCPPHEFDPETAAPTHGLVPVSDHGVVESWTWVDSRPGDPVPGGGFAWALIALDGTRGALFHALDTGGDPAAITVGMRVQARWREERVGSMTDIVAFVPEHSASTVQGSADATAGPVDTLELPFKMEYTYVAGVGRSVALRGLADGLILARTCPVCEQVYAPPPDHCARCLVELGEPFELPGTGVIDTFCVVNFPFPGQVHTPPYVVAQIRLDGAANRLMHRIWEIDPADVRIGLPVEPVWVPDAERTPSLGSIAHFRPVSPVRPVGGDVDA